MFHTLAFTLSTKVVELLIFGICIFLYSFKSHMESLFEIKIQVTGKDLLNAGLGCSDCHI